MGNARARGKGRVADLLVKKTTGDFSSIMVYSLILFLVIMVLIGWEWLVQAGRISPLFFPKPTEIAHNFIKMLQNGEIYLHLRATTNRLASGLIIGGLSGLFLGYLMGWFRNLYRVADPIIAALHPIPKISILPLFMILFGIGEASKVVVIAVAAFFPMFLSTVGGVRQINPLHFDVATSYGANRIQKFTKIVFPSSLPMVLVGIRLAANTALLLTIAVELITAQEGLGSVIWLSWQTLRTENLYISLAVIAFLGIGMNLLLQYFAKVFAPWQAALDI